MDKIGNLDARNIIKCCANDCNNIIVNEKNNNRLRFYKLLYIRFTIHDEKPCIRS